MVFSISVVILSFCLIVTAYASNCSNIICDDVHFFLARGTNEPYPGRQGDLVAATCNGLSSCGYEDLVYSSLNSDLACQSLYDGAIAGHIQMAAYASACPNSKLILSGFSKGAAIITSILGGGGGPSFNGCEEPATPAMDRTTKPGSQSEKFYLHLHLFFRISNNTQLLQPSRSETTDTQQINPTISAMDQQLTVSSHGHLLNLQP